MMRILLTGLVVFVIIVLVRRVLAGFSRYGQDRRELSSSLMVRCDHCGLHLPENEALVSGERYFCCEEHRMAVEKREE